MFIFMQTHKHAQTKKKKYRKTGRAEPHPFPQIYRNTLIKIENTVPREL